MSCAHAEIRWIRAMQASLLRRWWLLNRKALTCGLAAGLVWGFLTAASATPRDWLVYDAGQGIVHQYRDGALPTAVAAERFFAEYNVTLAQITLIYLALTGPAGWATWQFTRLRPRGEEQPALREGLDWYVIGLAMGGLICVWLFRILGLALWFKGPTLTPVAVVSVALEILLPLYMGASLFLVWLLRLKSIRAPDWATHYPRPTKRPPGAPRFRWLRRKGGDSPDK